MQGSFSAHTVIIRTLTYIFYTLIINIIYDVYAYSNNNNINIYIYIYIYIYISVHIKGQFIHPVAEFDPEIDGSDTPGLLVWMVMYTS